MKSLILAAFFSALLPSAIAGAPSEQKPQATATVIADAGRLGAASLTALNHGRWSPAHSDDVAPSAGASTDVDTGTLLLVLGIAGALVVRPVVRSLRRQEQQRRATALASTLHKTH